MGYKTRFHLRSVVFVIAQEGSAAFISEQQTKPNCLHQCIILITPPIVSTQNTQL